VGGSLRQPAPPLSSRHGAITALAVRFPEGRDCATLDAHIEAAARRFPAAVVMAELDGTPDLAPQDRSGSTIDHGAGIYHYPIRRQA
jgi:hypothetical protein